MLKAAPLFLMVTLFFKDRFNFLCLIFLQVGGGVIIYNIYVKL